MLFLYINNVDRTGDLQINTLKKTNQIQQRSDNIAFTLFQGSKPSENQDTRLFSGDTVASIAANVITLNGYFEKNVSKFYIGQKIFLRIGQTNETTAIVQNYNESTLQLTLTATPSITVNAGDRIGEIIFGGVTTRCKDVNIEVLANLEYPTEVVGYEKIFDKKLIADTWADVDARYIINDFLNTTINYNNLVDTMSYPDNASLQAEWIESLDGNNPVIDNADFLEATSSAVFGWTFAGGSAKWEGSPSAKNVSIWTGANNGAPIKGFLMLWVKPADFTKITNIKMRIGSDNANYAEVTLPAPTSNNFQYLNANLKTATIVGVPNWTAMDYAAIIVTETGSSSIRINGFRLNADGSFTAKNLSATTVFNNFRANNIKPTVLMQTLSKNFFFVWFIDYERDVHFVPNATSPSPFGLSDVSGNFRDLTIEVDQSQLGNSVIVEGGETDSISEYAQVIPGDNAKREWILKNKFKNLKISIDDNTSVHAAEVGTNTTNIKITAHGLINGQHVINRTRANAVREVSVVDADNFTVETVPSQTNGDSITFFAVSVTVGVEGIDNEASFDYMSNFQRQSVRNSQQTITLPSTSFIRFQYIEKIPVLVKYTDTASANALKNLGIGDGVFDLLPIADISITDLTTAITLAQAKVQDYKNPIITTTFKTDQLGLKAGQVISVQDSVRGINTTFVIQIVKWKQQDGEFNDYFIFDVTAGTTLFGLVEFFQKLLAGQSQITDNTGDIIETFVTASEVVQSHAAEAAALGGFKKATQNEDVTTHAAEHTYKHNAGIWEWEPSVGQDLLTRWNLFDWA